MSLIIKNFNFLIEEKEIKKKLRIKENSFQAKIVTNLLQESKTIANPKIIYNVLNIDKRGLNYIETKKIKFFSKILKNNFTETEIIFPHIITCGIELDKWSEGKNDIFENYIAEEIKTTYLIKAIEYFNNFINNKYPGKKSTVNPGSLIDWSVTEQKKIFDILENVTELTGVKINDSALMTPVKSLSGITYFSEITFENCQLCKRINCPGRRAKLIKT